MSFEYSTLNFRPFIEFRLDLHRISVNDIDHSIWIFKLQYSSLVVLLYFKAQFLNSWDVIEEIRLLLFWASCGVIPIFSALSFRDYFLWGWCEANGLHFWAGHAFLRLQRWLLHRCSFRRYWCTGVKRERKLFFFVNVFTTDSHFLVISICLF